MTATDQERARQQEQALRSLKGLKPLLKDWHESRGSNLITVQRRRQAELQDAEEMFKEVVHVVKPEKRVRLTMTSEFLGALAISSDADDIISESSAELLIINPLELDLAQARQTRMPNIAGLEVSRLTLYVGQPSFLLRIDRVAQILSDNGELDIVDFQPLPDSV